MKIRSYLLSLAMISTPFVSHTAAVNAQPSRLESKVSQCQRFENNLIRWNDNISAPTHGLTIEEMVESNLAILNTEIGQLERDDFQDAKLQSLHTEFRNHLITSRNHLNNALQATADGNSAKAEKERVQLQALPYQIAEVIKGFEQYCGKASDNRWVEKALGTYKGHIWSNDRWIPSTTEFRQARDGSLVGRYTMQEPGKLVPGTLSQCRAIGARKLQCVWDDKYGAGTLDVTFAADFSQFDGAWGIGKAEPSYPWSGGR